MYENIFVTSTGFIKYLRYNRQFYLYYRELRRKLKNYVFKAVLSLGFFLKGRGNKKFV